MTSAGSAEGLHDSDPVCVVGAGAAGMMAALVAAERGAEVVLLEKSVLRGTNAQLSGGLLQAAGTRFQEALGIEDSPEVMMADIMRKNGGDANAAVVEAVCRRSKDFVHLIADRVGLVLHLNTSIPWHGHSAFRMHAGPSEHGSELVTTFRHVVRDHPRITFMDKARVSGLAVEDGRVVGVRSGYDGGADDVLTARAVVLACDGFGGNKELLGKYCPDALSAHYIGSENNVGDGLLFGLAVGADVEWMGSWQGHAHVNPKHGTHLSGGLPYLGSFMVNLNGVRFAREDEGYSELTPRILAQPSGLAVEIFDQRIVDAMWDNGVFRQGYDAGAVKRFESVAELADGFGLPAQTLEETMRSFDAAAQGTEPDPFGRTSFGKPLEAPYYAALITGGLAHTQGGLRIDASTAVLDERGEAIAGLYAAGGTAAGMSGRGVDGYTSGNGLAHAFATGLIAGEQVSF